MKEKLSHKNCNGDCLECDIEPDCEHSFLGQPEYVEAEQDEWTVN